jgi:tetratricopeptide (TPR) repeat protein
LDVHEKYGEALLAAKNYKTAISEFKEAVALDPKRPHSAFELATAIEATGDWIAALDQYRKAALVEIAANRDFRPGATVYLSGEAEAGYKAAQTRFSEHLKALTAEGKTEEAKELQRRLQALDSSSDLVTKVQMAIQSGDQAATARKYDECETFYKQAVDLAEHLPSGDVNQTEALKKLAILYQFQQHYQMADTLFHRELAIIEKRYGAESERVIDPLYSLGQLAYVQKNYAEEVNYLNRSLEINLKLFGENSQRTEDNLRLLGIAYKIRNEWAQAEPYFIRAVRAEEAVSGPDSYTVMMSLPLLCNLYDGWARPDKAQPCWHRSIGLMESQFGKDSPDLAPYIQAEVSSLRQLGKKDEADKLEQRVAKLKQTSAQTN